ncbi:MAG: hypothetical protein H7X94_08880 [Vallitaleaceae bacterium]|nr:hypothetical protein [Vallitaleaceae bacterium]
MNAKFEFSAHPLWISILLGVLIAALLLTQSIFIFRDAQKRRVFPWFWGFWALTTVPSPFIVYYFVVMRRKKKIL